MDQWVAAVGNFNNINPALETTRFPVKGQRSDKMAATPTKEEIHS